MPSSRMRAKIIHQVLKLSCKTLRYVAKLLRDLEDQQFRLVLIEKIHSVQIILQLQF